MAALPTQRITCARMACPIPASCPFAVRVASSAVYDELQQDKVSPQTFTFLLMYRATASPNHVLTITLLLKCFDKTLEEKLHYFVVTYRRKQGACEV